MNALGIQGNDGRPGARRLAIRFGLALAGLPALTLLYLLAAVFFGLLAVNTDYRPVADGVDVYVRSNGVHMDVIVPMRAAGIDWRTRLPIAVLTPIEGVTENLAFGWGDRGFYLATPKWSDLRVSTAFWALTGLDTSVLHVEAVDLPEAGVGTRHIQVSAEHYRRLAAFIESSFRLDRSAAKIVIPDVHYGYHDAFFEAQGHYSLFMTCNEWTRRSLATAGVRVPLWAPFDTAILYQLPAGE